MKAASTRPSADGARSGLMPASGKRFGSWTVRLPAGVVAGFCTAAAVGAAVFAGALVGAAPLAAVGFAAAGVGLPGAEVAGAVGAAGAQACSRLAPATALAAIIRRTKRRRSNVTIASV